MEDNIKIYLCGVTVYDDSHIGHARTIIIFDVLRRYLEYKGYNVQLVQNFTDIDDKIISRARDEGVAASEISDRYINRYHEDFDGLRVRRASAYPRATEHMPDIITMINDLIKKNMAYVSANGVYFAVSRFSRYGKLSKKRIDDLQAGARIDADETKRDPMDFALWKFADTEPKWESPWGAGRPGWHIECSAMSLRYLGGGLEIHGGGRDLIFPHHENEIAQSEAHTGRRLAKAWMHVGMVTIDGQKMSKSLGNVKSVRYMLENWGPNIIRLFCLSGHYSKPIDYSEELLKECVILWRQIETAYFEIIHARGDKSIRDISKISRACNARFVDAMEDDFNTHEALSAFLKLVKEINRLAAGGLLTRKAGDLAMKDIDSYMDVLGLYIPKMTESEFASISELVAKRDELRQAGRYEEADDIRDKITIQGIELLDHESATSWIKRERIESG